MSRKAKRKCERRPAAFKQMAVERMEEGKIRALGKELGVPVSGLYPWKQQAEGRSDVGPPADVYSLGAILYRVLTGKVPFESASLTELLYQVCREAPRPPREIQTGNTTGEFVCAGALV